jgi:protein TonB
MKFAWYTAFALPVLCTSLSYPQASPPGPAATPTASTDAKAVAPPGQPGGKGPVITEAELKERLTGRPLFLRGLWLDETLHFNMYGDLVGQSPKGSFTLCGVMIDHVRMTKKTVELEGIRFGVHFEGEAPWEDQSTSFDRIQITPKKKRQVIVIDRQLVVIPKKKKGEKETAGTGLNPMSQNQGHGAPGAVPVPAADGSAAVATNAGTDSTSQSQSNGAPATEPAPAADGSSAVATNARKDPTSQNQGHGTAEPTTISPAESAEHLRTALNKILAPDLDDKMIAQMPDYWQFFYQAQQSHKWLEPTDQTLVHPGPGVDGPKILKNVVPASNDFAQKGEVAGVASYKVILDPQGKILAVAVYRPIGFGLDENAVAAIEKSSFAPAVKDGKPASSVIDVAVNFRIYSKRTAAGGTDTAAADANASPVTGKPALPGIYSTQAAQAQSQPHQ